MAQTYFYKDNCLIEVIFNPIALGKAKIACNFGLLSAIVLREVWLYMYFQLAQKKKKKKKNEIIWKG